MSKITNQSKVTSKYQLPDQSILENTAQSNISETEYMTTSFTKVRTTEKEFGSPGEEIKQTLTLTNNSYLEIENVRIKDTISSEGTFVDGSLTIDNQPKANFNPVTGFTLESSILANNTVVISYKIKIDENASVNTVDTISNITYDLVDVSDLSENSNEVNVTVNKVKITITKTSDKSGVIKGQKLLFQNVVKNEGNIENTDVTFIDPIPEGAQFIEDSVKIDNISKPGFNPATGFKLDNLTPNSEITITFEVTIL